MLSSKVTGGNRRDSLVEQAERYADLGVTTFPLVPRGKVPPRGFSWTEHAADPLPVGELPWEDGGNLGVAAGDASDGLVVADFDDADAYDQWAMSSRFSTTLPTVNTARGYHIYLRTDLGDFADATGGRKNVTLANGAGELRATYVAAPASVHESGASYTWRDGWPEDIPYISDLWATGLLDSCAAVPNAARATQDIYRPAGLDVGIQRAVLETVPTGFGERNARIFNLARRLTPMHLGDDELRGVFDWWWQRAKPVVRTKARHVSERAFWHALEHVRRPHGATVHQLTAHVTGTGIDRLKGCCEALSRQRSGGAFFLDARTAGVLCGVHFSTASRWLKRLCENGPLKLLRRGSRKESRASEYEWTG